MFIEVHELPDQERDEDQATSNDELATGGHMWRDNRSSQGLLVWARGAKPPRNGIKVPPRDAVSGLRFTYQRRNIALGCGIMPVSGVQRRIGGGNLYLALPGTAKHLESRPDVKPAIKTVFRQSVGMTVG